MKYFATIAFALSAALGTQWAWADSNTYEYPVLNDYQILAQDLVDQTKAAQSSADVNAIRGETEDLIKRGVEIMHLYGEKNPACAEQYKAFEAALPTMEDQPLDWVKKEFHDGEGLPSAPKHCYFGRSEVVHPVMNVIRFKGEWSETVRKQVIDDFQEVIEHLARIQQNLDNPPN